MLLLCVIIEPKLSRLFQPIRASQKSGTGIFPRLAPGANFYAELQQVNRLFSLFWLVSFAPLNSNGDYSTTGFRYVCSVLDINMFQTESYQFMPQKCFFACKFLLEKDCTVYISAISKYILWVWQGLPSTERTACRL